MFCPPLSLGKLNLRESYKRYTSRPDFAVVGKLRRAFVTRTGYRLAPAPITDDVIDHCDGLFVVAPSDKLQQMQHRPWAHPDLGGPTSSRAEPVVGIKLSLVNEDTNLAVNNFLQVQEGLGGSMAVLHTDDIGFFDQFFKGGNRYGEFVILWIMIDNDIEAGKKISDIMIKFDRILDMKRLVIRHSQ